MPDMVFVKNLRKNYKNLEAVKGIDFTVEEGSFFALLGENGAGKTTTINIIATLIKKTSGDVMIGKHRLDKEDELIRKDIGVVFQESILDKYLTVRENIISRGLLYGRTKKDITGHMLELTEKMGITDILDRRYGNLSGGQKRRADIVRALVGEPKLLILDEPTAGLDPYARKCVWEVIRQLKEERRLTIILTTHYMEEAACADYILVMDAGEIKAYGTPQQLGRAYGSDRLIFIFKEESAAAELMEALGYPYKKDRDRYIINIGHSFEALDIVHKLRDKIECFEVVRGNMEDVFLNITSNRHMERGADTRE